MISGPVPWIRDPLMQKEHRMVEVSAQLARASLKTLVASACKVLGVIDLQL